MINIDQNLIFITFVSSALLTTLLISLVLSLKKISLWIRIYLLFIVWFALYILFFVYLYIIADIVEEINNFLYIIKVTFCVCIVEFTKPMTIEGIFEDSSLIDLIISPMDNTSDDGSRPNSPWLTRPATPEGLLAVTTPPNVPSFDPLIWRKGEVSTAYASENIFRVHGFSPNTDPAAVGYYPGRSNNLPDMRHTIFDGALYRFTHIEGTIITDNSTINIWVKPGRDIHTYYITKDNYTILHQIMKPNIVSDYGDEVQNMTQFQRSAYFNRKTDEHINLTLQISDIPRILRSHQIPIANRGA